MGGGKMSKQLKKLYLGENNVATEIVIAPPPELAAFEERLAALESRVTANANTLIALRDKPFKANLIRSYANNTTYTQTYGPVAFVFNRNYGDSRTYVNDAECMADNELGGQMVAVPYGATVHQQGQQPFVVALVRNTDISLQSDREIDPIADYDFFEKPGDDNDFVHAFLSDGSQDEFKPEGLIPIDRNRIIAWKAASKVEEEKGNDGILWADWKRTEGQA